MCLCKTCARFSRTIFVLGVSLVYLLLFINLISTLPYRLAQAKLFLWNKQKEKKKQTKSVIFKNQLHFNIFPSSFFFFHFAVVVVVRFFFNSISMASKNAQFKFEHVRVDLDVVILIFIYIFIHRFCRFDFISSFFLYVSLSSCLCERGTNIERFSLHRCSLIIDKSLSSFFEKETKVSMSLHLIFSHCSYSFSYQGGIHAHARTHCCFPSCPSSKTCDWFIILFYVHFYF